MGLHADINDVLGNHMILTKDSIREFIFENSSPNIFDVHVLFYATHCTICVDLKSYTPASSSIAVDALLRNKFPGHTFHVTATDGVEHMTKDHVEDENIHGVPRSHLDNVPSHTPGPVICCHGSWAEDWEFNV